jgi:hypothetical protein
LDSQFSKYSRNFLNVALFALLLCASVARGEKPAATTQTVVKLTVFHATTLPTRNEKFQADLNDALMDLAKRDVDMPTRLRALADWTERSGAAKMMTDDVIQQAFLMFCEFRKHDEIRAILLLAFLKSSLAVPPGNFAISLTRYLDYPDADVREAALQVMDAEGVFALAGSYERDGFDVVDYVLPQPFDMSQLPAPFLEAMLYKEPADAWVDMDNHRSRGETNQDTAAQRQALAADGARVAQVAFHLRQNDYPFTSKSKEVEAILTELLKSDYWYSRLMVAHMLKHHLQYITKEIMASLNGDSSKAVRELTKLISGNPESSSENQMWPDSAKHAP